MIIFMLIMMVLMAGNADILGHLGGALFGFFFGLAFYPRPATNTGKKCRMGGLILFTGLAVLMLGLLFGLQHDTE